LDDGPLDAGPQRRAGVGSRVEARALGGRGRQQLAILGRRAVPLQRGLVEAGLVHQHLGAATVAPDGMELHRRYPCAPAAADSRAAMLAAISARHDSMGREVSISNSKRSVISAVTSARST